MKTKLSLKLSLFTMLVTVALTSRADLFFSDSFINGSTLNSATPANPTPTSTAYEMVSSKSWNPTPTIAANDLKFGIAATSSGFVELEALFATNAVALVLPGDFVQLTVVFTDTSGILTTTGNLGFGLFNSGQVKPIAGGLNNTIGNTFSGGAQNWVGYESQTFAGSVVSTRIATRPVQTGTTGINQDLVSSSTSSSYPGAVTVGTTFNPNLTLTAGSVYTEVLNITLNGTSSLAITNVLYAGPNTSGTIITNYGGIATNTTFLTGGFDGLAIGYTGRSSSAGAPLFDLSSIQVTGSVSPITSPPIINTQPISVNVATNGSTLFSIVATGFNVTYQWKRNNTNLLNGGNIAGATSSTLVINNASTADAFSGANGYYCIVSGAGNFSTNSLTNSLTLVPAKNLVWSGAGNIWDLTNSVNWVNGATPATFNYGDKVTFNDVGAANEVVTVTGNFLSPSTWTITGSTAYEFDSTGIIAGTGTLIDTCSSFVTLNTANTYTGGTIISNATAYVTLKQYQGIGTGPLTLAQAGGVLEVTPTGSATVGIAGDVILNDSFRIQFDGLGTFAGVILGNLTGGAGKTLTFDQPDTTTTNRYRLYGTNTVFNGNLIVNGNATPQAAYYGTVVAPYNSAGSQTYNGVISGNGGLVQRGSQSTVLNGQNTYAGGTFATAGGIAFGVDTIPTSGTVVSGPIGVGPLFVVPEQGSANGSGTIQANGGARTIANLIEYPSATNNQTLVIGGTNNLNLTGAMALQGQDGLGTPVNRTIQANNTGFSTFSGVISDGGLGFGITKTGANALYLNAANTYTGPTTNTAGVLAGSGTIAGSVFVQTNSSIGGGSGASMGTLNIGGSLNFALGGGGFFRLNKGGSPASDKVSVTGSINNLSLGTILVTNLGAALVPGDSFTLFNKAVVGGGTLAISGGGTTVHWNNNLAVNGSISVSFLTSTNPCVLTNSVSGGVVTFTWPADHLGWSLEAQTNKLTTGLGTNWVIIPGTANVTSTNFPIMQTNSAVFYRLILP